LDRVGQRESDGPEQADRTKRRGLPGAVGLVLPGILYFREDTFAVDMLARGGSPYDVAKLLGDTIETVDQCFGPKQDQEWNSNPENVSNG